MLLSGPGQERRFLIGIVGGAILGAIYAVLSFIGQPASALMLGSLLLGTAAMMAFQLMKQPIWLPLSRLLMLTAALLTPFALGPDSWLFAILLAGLALLLTMHYSDVRKILREGEGDRSRNP